MGVKDVSGRRRYNDLVTIRPRIGINFVSPQSPDDFLPAAWAPPQVPQAQVQAQVDARAWWLVLPPGFLVHGAQVSSWTASSSLREELHSQWKMVRKAQSSKPLSAAIIRKFIELSASD